MLTIPMITALAEAVRALCTFLSTDEGQATVKTWRTDTAAWSKAVSDALAWLKKEIK